MRIFGWLADYSGCGYYRLMLPLRELEARGHTTAAAPTLPIGAASRYDVIVGQRVCRPGASVTWQRLAREGRTRLVLEIDDDLFRIDPTNARAAAFYTLDMLRGLARNLAVANLVTVTTDRLAARMREHTDAPVIVLPNTVDAATIRPPAERPAGPLTVGWAGSDSHAGDWAETAGPVRRWLERTPGVRMRWIGNQFAKTPPDRTDVARWAPRVEDYYATLDGLDVGLAPLATSSFNNAKSHIKVLEYWARGAAVVAAAEPPYADLVACSGGGLLVERPHEWGHALDALADPELRGHLQARGREEVERWTIQEHAARWEAAYGALVDGRAAA